MSSRVLVLNADFMPMKLVPLSTVSWQEAITMVIKGSAVIVEAHPTKVIHTPTKEYPWPVVIIQKEYKAFKLHAKYSKANIKLRDGYTCQYCLKRFSEKSLTIDHVVPRAKGGKTTYENSTTACKPCNQKKKDRTDMKPATKPYRPTYYQLVKKKLINFKIENPAWTPYLKHLVKEDK